MPHVAQMTQDRQVRGELHQPLAWLGAGSIARGEDGGGAGLVAHTLIDDLLHAALAVAPAAGACHPVFGGGVFGAIERSFLALGDDGGGDSSNGDGDYSLLAVMCVCGSIEHCTFSSHDAAE